MLIRRTESTTIARDSVPKGGAGVVGSVAEFERALTRHYARSDRTGRAFTLMIMDLTRLSGAARWAVAEAASSRARATDHIGWLSGTSLLGAILYDCRRDPASRLAAAVCRDEGVSSDDVPTQVHLYPGSVPEGLERLLPERKPAR